MKHRDLHLKCSSACRTHLLLSVVCGTLSEAALQGRYVLFWNCDWTIWVSAKTKKTKYLIQAIEVLSLVLITIPRSLSPNVLDQVYKELSALREKASVHENVRLFKLHLDEPLHDQPIVLAVMPVLGSRTRKAGL